MRVLGVLIALALAGSAVAQPTPSAPNSAKLALARQVIEATGGARQFDRLMQNVMNNVVPNLPFGKNSPELQRLMPGMLNDFQQAFAKVTPQLLDISAQAYADVLSEQELRDYLAFLTSPSGRSITAKVPEIQSVAAPRQVPLLMSVMPEVMGKIADRVCDEKHCTAEERAQTKAALLNATSRSPR